MEAAEVVDRRCQDGRQDFRIGFGDAALHRVFEGVVDDAARLAQRIAVDQAQCGKVSLRGGAFLGVIGRRKIAQRVRIGKIATEEGRGGIAIEIGRLAPVEQGIERRCRRGLLRCRHRCFGIGADGRTGAKSGCQNQRHRGLRCESLHHRLSSVPLRAYLPPAAIQRSIFPSSTGSGRPPVSSTCAWKARMSKSSPSAASALRRSSWIFSAPTL